ncbi:cytochrome P450 709B2-like [Phragmites australis]|uniref:cytochrome P450 709B2-like n=1 Tax=Phragmites australis TaxID=29695 RepID=UPI002D7932FC|nr:cytochrome P450 709B2-like [Phragmites australis]
MAFLVPLALVALLVVAITWLWDYTIMRLVWRPYTIAKEFGEQGIHGPPYKFIKGCNENIKIMKEEEDSLVLDVHDHNYLSRIAPHYVKWRAQYGEPFLYWFGPKPRICIFDYDLARQVLSSKSGHFEKNDAPPTLVAAIGKGLALLDGLDWVRHRRVINPAFAMDRLKMMTETMLACAQSMVKEMENQASQNKNGEIEVDFNKEFRELTADVISHTVFGRSHKLGKEVFQTQHDLVAINMASLLDVQIPGLKYLPTERNKLKWMLEKKLRSSLLQIIQPRLASTSSDCGNDLLGLMLDTCMAAKQGGKEGGPSLSIDEIIHECKMFFFAGHDTTSLLLTWTVFLLSVYPEWQERLRKEVLRELGREYPSADALSKLKEMTMVLLETLRLYCPPLFMQRKTVTDMTVGAIKLPKGTAIVIPIPIMHRDKEVWGDNANEFNPLRFQNGITRAAKVPHALLAFSIGPRSCIGQNFAMLEAKLALVLMLQKFSFTISPKYVHAPVDLFMLKPKFGLPVILRRLDVCN